MKNIKACLSHQSDNWRTPIALYDRFMRKGCYDPCPYNASFDGLKEDWHKKNFVNPPYSQISKWVDKSIEEAKKGNLVYMLLPARVDTQWFKKLAFITEFNCIISFLEGRLKFNDSKSAPFPSMIVFLNGSLPCLSLYSTMEYMSKNDLQRFINE